MVPYFFFTIGIRYISKPQTGDFLAVNGNDIHCVTNIFHQLKKVVKQRILSMCVPCEIMCYLLKKAEDHLTFCINRFLSTLPFIL